MMRTSIRAWTGPFIATGLLVVTWLAVALVEPSAPPRHEPAKTMFSAGRGWHHIEQISQAPRPVGTREHDQARAYLLTELEDLGLEVDTLTTVASARWFNTMKSALTRNLMARLAGTASTGAILLVSHYDGVPLAPAAGDAGLGVATLLETARALTAVEPLRNDVVFLITDAEELGLLGAQAFAAEHPWMEDVAFVVNFEARGTSGAALMFETGPGSGWAVRELGRVGRRPVTSSLFPEAYARMPNDTDFTIFRRLGLPGLNFAIGGSAHWYHTPGDRPENLSPASLQHMGDNALAITRRLGQLDLGSVEPAERVFFHVPGLGLFGYGPGRALPLAGVLVVAFVATVVLARRRRQVQWWALPIGLLAAALASIAVLLLAHSLWLAISGSHLEWGALDGRALYREWPYALAIVALVLAIMTALFGLLRRWFALPGLVLGAFLVPLALALVTAVALPAGSYLFLWPTLLALGALNLVVVGSSGAVSGQGQVVEQPIGHRHRHDRREVWRLIALGLSSLGTLLIVAPVVYLTNVMVGMAAAPALAAAALLPVLLLLPLLDLLSRPNRWWLPATSAIAAAALVAYGLVGSAPADDRPAPSNLIHLQDGQRGVAYWASPATHNDPFISRFVGESADTMRLGDYSRFMLRGLYRAAPAPTWDAQPAQATVLENVELDDRRRLRLRLEWDDPPMMAEVWPESDHSHLLEPVDGRRGAPGTSAQPRSWLLERWGLTQPLELLIEAPADQPVALVVSARYQGLPHLEGHGGAVRPAGLMAVPAYRWFPAISDVRIVRESISF